MSNYFISSFFYNAFKIYQNFKISMNNHIKNDFSYKLLKLPWKNIINPRNTRLHHLVRTKELYNKKWNYQISVSYDKINTRYNYYIIISFEERNQIPSYNIKVDNNEIIEYPNYEKIVIFLNIKPWKKNIRRK